MFSRWHNNKAMTILKLDDEWNTCLILKCGTQTPFPTNSVQATYTQAFSTSKKQHEYIISWFTGKEDNKMQHLPLVLQYKNLGSMMGFSKYEWLAKPRIFRIVVVVKY